MSTADRLRALADAATPIAYCGVNHGELIALAPDLARGYADALDALAALRRNAGEPGVDYPHQIADEADAALAEAERLLP